VCSVIISDVNKDWTHKDQDKDKDQSHKDKEKDWTHKDKDLNLVLKESLRTKTRINITASSWIQNSSKNLKKVTRKKIKKRMNSGKQTIYKCTFVVICQWKIRTSQGLYHKDKDQINKDKDKD